MSASARSRQLGARDQELAFDFLGHGRALKRGGRHGKRKQSILTLIIRLIKCRAMIKITEHQNPASRAIARRPDARRAGPRRAEAVRPPGLRRHLDARDRRAGQGQYRLDRLSFRRQGRAARGLRRLHRRDDPGHRRPGARHRSAGGRSRRRSGAARSCSPSLERMVGLHRRAARRPARSCSSSCASCRSRRAALDRIYDGVFEPIAPPALPHLGSRRPASRPKASAPSSPCSR